MSSTALSPDPPMSSGEMQAIDFDRAEEVARRHVLLTEYLKLRKLDGLLLVDPANFGWLTCGGENRRGEGFPPAAAILLTAEARVVLCNNVDSGQIFDRQLMGLGFLLKERPWSENLRVLQQDVCRGRRMGTDGCMEGATNVSEELTAFRLQYSNSELDRFRQLGRDVAHAVEATARNFEPGATEAEVAGHLAHRLIKHGIEPVRMQVLADGQGWRYRHWAYGSDRVERHCVISAMGRRQGLHIGAARTVCMGSPSEEMQRVHHLATLVQTTGMYFTQHGWSMDETWKRVARIYEKFQIPDEWRCADQADVIGYQPCEMPFIPGSSQKFQNQTAVLWQPSVRSSLVGDTMLVQDDGFEILTPSQNWPQLAVRVKHEMIARPGILIREYPAGGSALFS